MSLIRRYPTRTRHQRQARHAPEMSGRPVLDILHRTPGRCARALYFLTSETLLHPASVTPVWEPEAERGSRGEDTTLNIAVLRVCSASSADVESDSRR